MVLDSTSGGLIESGYPVQPHRCSCGTPVSGQHQVDLSILLQQLSNVGQPPLLALQHLAELGYCLDDDKEYCVKACIAEPQCFDEGKLHTLQLRLVAALCQLCRLTSCWPAS